MASHSFLRLICRHNTWFIDGGERQALLNNGVDQRCSLRNLKLLRPGLRPCRLCRLHVTGERWSARQACIIPDRASTCALPPWALRAYACDAPQVYNCHLDLLAWSFLRLMGPLMAELKVIAGLVGGSTCLVLLVSGLRWHGVQMIEQYWCLDSLSEHGL